MNSLIKSIVFLVSLLITQLLFADNGETEEELLSLYGSEEMISIATGHSTLLSKAPAVASVITAEDIKKIGATDIDEILETVPGLHVVRDSVAYNPRYTFRGIHSDFNPQVLMLINGIPITNLFLGNRGQLWGGMQVEAIERVEIIRGPGSAIYGADAFAGVINVITKSGETYSGLETGVRLGSFNSQSAFVSYGDSWNDGSVVTILELYETDGWDGKIEQDAQTFWDILTGTSASLAPGRVDLGRRNIDFRFDLSQGGFLLRAGFQQRDQFEMGAGVASALDHNSEYKSDRINFDVSYTWKDFLVEDLSLDILASYLSTSQEVKKNTVLFPAGTTGPFLDPDTLQPIFGTFPDGIIGNPEAYERHSRFGITGHYQAIDNHDLSFAVGYYYGDLHKVKETKNFGINPNTGLFILPGSPLVDVTDTPLVYLRESDRKNYYGYIQDIFRFGNDWELTAGVRYDHYSDFGDTVNPRLALVWSTSQNLTTKFLYGEAFRAPAFSETRAINNPTALGNPALDPETLKSYELVFDYKPTYELDLVFNTFYYQWQDIIQFVPDALGGTRTAQNTGEQKGYGLEFEVVWRVTDEFRVLGNFAWQRSTDELSDDEAGNAPERQFYVRADWEFKPDYNLNVQANWVMQRERVFNDLRPEIDDYVLVDLTLRKKNIFGNWEAALIAKNLFDEDAREPTPNGVPVPFIPNDLPLPGRALYGEIRYHF